jgi:hypothetical protein
MSDDDPTSPEASGGVPESLAAGTPGAKRLRRSPAALAWARRHMKARKYAPPADETAPLPAGTKKFLIQDVPAEVHRAALEKSKLDHVPLRSILMAALVAYIDGDIELNPGKRRKRRGRRPGRSIHVWQGGQLKAVIQPQRISARLQEPTEPAPEPPGPSRTREEPLPDVRMPREPKPPVDVPLERQKLTPDNALAKLRAKLGG